MAKTLDIFFIGVLLFPFSVFAASLEVIPANPESADTVIIHTSGDVKSASFGGVPIEFVRGVTSSIAIVGIDIGEKNPKNVLVKLSDGKILRQRVLIKVRRFPKVPLITPPGMSAKKIIQGITKNDASTLITTSGSSLAKPLFRQAFQKPLSTWIDVGGYGVTRVSKVGSLRHLGVDLKAPPGTPVSAINDGKISFVGDLPHFGTSVIIDHGLGIVSLYLHLLEARVQKDDVVKRGDVIGAVGSTGEYSLEPHLHFSIRIGRKSVDPRRFLDRVNAVLTP